VWKNFFKKKSAVIMMVMFILLFIFTFIAPEISLFDVNTLRIDNSLAFQSPNETYWFGTDNLGRDYWSQVWSATRTSIILSVSVSVGQILVGTIIGLVWGYVRKLDRFFTELYNFMDNVPTIIYMTLIALMIGQSVLIMGVAMICFYWLGTARNVRNLVFMYRDREYNLASRCLGTGLWRILTKNIFPYLISVIVLRLALSIPGIIAYETTLSYLGLLDITTPSLGILLRDARSNFLEYPYLLIFPAAIVSLITVTFYLVGNAFSDACDPRNHV
jgi:oligopeptide transport system permease protein